MTYTTSKYVATIIQGDNIDTLYRGSFDECFIFIQHKTVNGYDKAYIEDFTTNTIILAMRELS